MDKDPALLWCRPAAVAPIKPLAWELPRVAGAALKTIKKNKIDSLVSVVLQNKSGLALLAAEKGGICAALQGSCCFYKSKLGLVREDIKCL